MPLFKKKKKIPVVGVPYNLQKTTGYQAVPGAVRSIPSADLWWSSMIGTDRKPPTDPELVLITRYLRSYHDDPSSWNRFAALGQLYFLSDHWLKVNKRTGGALPSFRERTVFGLFKTVAEELCKDLKCSVNLLPQMIELYWGRVLTHHGYQVDNQLIKPGQLPTVANYLSQANLEKYRLTFKNGRAWQVPWWRPHGPYGLVPAESAKVGWTYAPGITDQMFERGFAGFALSMGRDFYMATHHGGYDRKNFFHSSYLAGGAVLCTGSLLIRNGQVLWVKNDSGHYQPTLDHLVNVVQTLEMYGVPPATVGVRAVPYSWKDDRTGRPGTVKRDFRGDTLLRLRGQGWDTYARELGNRDNLKARGWTG